MKTFSSLDAQVESYNAGLPLNPIALNQLKLPLDFTSRAFLTNNVGNKSLEGIAKLVGSVVKKSVVNHVEAYEETGNNYKKNGVVIVPTEPANGVLVKNTYNRKIGSIIKFLIAGASFDNDIAYEILVNDIAEASIEGSELDKDALYNAYGTEADKDAYYIILAAVSTSLTYSTYNKTNSKADFSISAVSVNGSYYKDGSSLFREWKIGFKPIKISEFLKGYTPAKQPVTETPS